MGYKSLKNINFVLASTKIAKQITTEDISEFTSINDPLALEYGCIVRNFSIVNIMVKTNANVHGSNSGYLLKPSESIFVEVDDISKIQTLNQSGTGAVSIEVIGA